jgi:hypothetical protein
MAQLKDYDFLKIWNYMNSLGSKRDYTIDMNFICQMQIEILQWP